MMNLIFMLISLFTFFIGYSYIMNRKYILMMLLSLEFLSLILFLMMYVNGVNLGVEVYFLMVFLVFCVSEGVLGLSLLVSMIRSHGSDVVYSLSILAC